MPQGYGANLAAMTDIHQLKIPIPNNPLEYNNAYLVKTGEGSLLIDTGWNSDEAFAALRSQVENAGVPLSDLKVIAITHAHPDHYGLVGRLKQGSQAEVLMHRLEGDFLASLDGGRERGLQEMERWLAMNGAPDDLSRNLERMTQASRSLFPPVPKNLRLLQGGEHLPLGDYNFEVIWTPGHAPGHICLYEPGRRIFFSGDHVLPDISPNVSMNDPNGPNPLVGYLASLKRVISLSVDIVYPGHGEPFAGLAQRAQELLDHHQDRQKAILATFNGKPQTAYQIAALIPWSVAPRWEDIPRFHRRMAVTETISHLELLAAAGVLTRSLAGGFYFYSQA